MLNATLTDRADVAPGLFIVKIKPDFEIPDFVPGQYVALGLCGDKGSDQKKDGAKPKMIRRAYSVASSPAEKKALEFYLALVDEGELTPCIEALQPGDRIFVTPKFVGTFTLQDVPLDRDLVLISTGTGIAPYISMLREGTILENYRSITVLHGVRYTSDLAYREELLALEEKYPHMRYFATVSRPDASWSGDKGYVGQYLENGSVALDPKNVHFFLCGNPAMIQENETFLVDRGFSVHSKRNPGNIHLEKYW